MFEWDEGKNLANVKKHGISFEEASLVFEGLTFAVTDGRFDYGEMQTISIGRIQAMLAVLVVHTDRNGRPGSSQPGERAAKKHGCMMTISKKRLEKLASKKDEDIDFSDIPALDEDFWKHATLVQPDTTQQVTLRVKRSVLDAYKAMGKGYQTRMNSVLETYARTLPTKPS